MCPNGELLGQLKKVGSFDEKCASFYAAEIVNALEALHNDGIIHRDLKVKSNLKNIYVDCSLKIYYWMIKCILN